MAEVRIEKLRKSFGAVEVLKDIDLTVEDGAFVVLVGPSGCGKSTLLRSIAGLEPVSDGIITIGGRKVNDLAPAQREIAMVFQSYALYPHMDVAANMGFGLRFAGTPKAEIAARVAEAARILQLEPLLKRRPRELSGGQRQRVAIGRAIVRKPQVFLFDEPLSNLDAALRINTRVEIAKLHKLLAATIVYVTHDQVEAMTLADKIVVMNQGRVEQQGKPLELYYRQCLRRRLHRLAGHELPARQGHPRGSRPRRRWRAGAPAPGGRRSGQCRHARRQTGAHADCGHRGRPPHRRDGRTGGAAGRDGLRAPQAALWGRGHCRDPW